MEEVEQAKREIAFLKKVKDKLFLEIQRIKVPPKRPVFTEKEVQTEQADQSERAEELSKEVKQL